MSKVFFTADPHFGHANIIKYCSRPFANIDENDKTILENMNAVVGENDELYILGDFCFGDPRRYLDQIKCRNLFFVVGSHDKQMWSYKGRFVKFHDKICATINGQLIVMTHCAHGIVWDKSHHGSWNLYGHSHGRLGNSREGIFVDEYQKAIALILSRSKSMDVGVDGHGFKPYSFDEVKAILDKKRGFVIEKRASQEAVPREWKETDYNN